VAEDEERRAKARKEEQKRKSKEKEKLLAGQVAEMVADFFHSIYVEEEATEGVVDEGAVQVEAES
jgi:hypothetical protein